MISEIGSEEYKEEKRIEKIERRVHQPKAHAAYGVIQEIENDNCKDMCDNLYCDQPYTHYIYLKLNGMDVVLSLCKECAEEWDENTWYLNTFKKKNER